MARQLRIEIDGDSSSGRKAIDGLAAEADKAAKELSKMEAKADAAAVKARKLAEAEERAGDKTRQLTERMAALQKEIAESGDESGALTRKLERLQIAVKTSAHATDDYRRAASRAASESREQARAYDKVADNAAEAARAVAALAAVQALTKKQGTGKGLGKLLGIGSDASRLAAAGGSAFGAATGAAGSLASGAGPYGTAIGVGLGAFPALGAGIFAGAAAGGGVLTGAGLAGAGAGLAGAWGSSTEFAASWNKSLDQLQKRWKDSSAAFGNELADGLKVADRALRDLPVERILALSQSFVGPLAEGAAGGLTALADGFADSLDHAQPAVDELGTGINNLGADAGDALRIISQGGDGGAHALGDLTDAVGFVIKSVALLILGFELAYEKIRNFEKANFDFISTVPVVGSVVDGLKDSLFGIDSAGTAAGRALHGAGDATVGVTGGWGDMAAEAARAAVATLDLNDAITENRNLMLGLADANIAVAQGWLDLKDELKDGVKTLDLSYEAGIKNQKAISGQIGLLEQQREQAIETGGGTADAIGMANEAYDASIAKLRANAIEAGFNAGEVDRLIASMGAVQPLTTGEVQIKGLAGSLSQGISLGNALNNIDNRTFSASVRISGIADAARATASFLGAHADGGTMPFSGPKLVGEEGPEIVWGSQGQFVSTAEQTKKLMRANSPAPASGGASAGVGSIAMPNMSIIEQAIAAVVMKLMQNGRLQVPDRAVVGR